MSSESPILIGEAESWRLVLVGDQLHLGIHTADIAALHLVDGWLTVELDRELVSAISKEWEAHRAQVEGTAGHADLLDFLIENVARAFSLRTSKVLSDRHGQLARRARHVIMFLARKHGHLSYPEIARPFGMEHTTVLRTVRNIRRELAHSNQDWLIMIQEVERRLGLPHQPDGPLPSEVSEADRSAAAADAEE